MSGYKIPVILFFIAGMTPTDDEVAEANAIGYVRFRNVSAMLPTDKPERCDAVAGSLIPVTYADKPVVASLADVMDIMKEKQEAEARDVAAHAANPSVEIVGKEGKGKKETAGNPMAKAAWKANA